MPGRPWRALGAAGGVLGGEGLAMAVHPAFGEVMAAGDVTVVLFLAVVLVAAILAGDDQACERAFRLLRWVADRPEPPAPAQPCRTSTEGEEAGVNVPGPGRT